MTVIYCHDKKQILYGVDTTIVYFEFLYHKLNNNVLLLTFRYTWLGTDESGFKFKNTRSSLFQKFH